MSPSNPPRSVRAGRVLGRRYTLVSRIAKGGMGEVWRVRDQRTGMLVAAKVLRPELRGEEISLSRLRLEAKNTVRARHPNIATVMDSGEDEGQGWIVMELIDGRPLTDYVGEGKRLSAEQLIPVLTQSAYALDASAQAGVVHRDIKPANIMIRPDGMVKLTDFGISFAQGQANLTAVGMVMGTAQYLAPEQAMGGEATTAGDLYSLGIIAYEALAGRRPFTGKSPVEIAMAHVRDEIPALPADVPEPIQQIVFGLLAKNPAERPPSGAALVRILSRVASEMGTSTAPTPLPLPPAGEPEQPSEPEQQLPAAIAPTGPGRAASEDRAESGEGASTHPQTRPQGQKVVTPQPVDAPPAPRPSEQAPLRPNWRPVGERAVPDSSKDSPPAPAPSAKDSGSTEPAKSSAGGMWVVAALVVLTVVLILIAMTRDRVDAASPDDPSSMIMVSTMEEPTWWNQAHVC